MPTTIDTREACEKLVRHFLGAWTGRNLETLCACFADHAVYHNVPVAPIKGIAGIRQIFVAFLDAFETASLDIIALAAEPGLVIAERIDLFLMRNGTRIALPVTGVFEIRNGKITRFSDYFDLADFERQSGMKL
ncbi:nuclear transport factor 2 family protein [Nevskia sp.]|uniref:nuclear transport factor 2 family protein n=1 Tax=Nevskia sp. TaxID=1929292 RepID=UPI0025D59E45|nr:nuclear transport factor 2 family protein [Nevskia sp.]